MLIMEEAMHVRGREYLGNLYLPLNVAVKLKLI